MERKVLEDAVSYIRGLAERHGRNADWAEEAVREAVNLGAEEALEKNVIDVVSPNLRDLLQQVDEHNDHPRTCFECHVNQGTKAREGYNPKGFPRVWGDGWAVHRTRAQPTSGRNLCYPPCHSPHLQNNPPTPTSCRQNTRYIHTSSKRIVSLTSRQRCRKLGMPHVYH